MLISVLATLERGGVLEKLVDEDAVDVVIVVIDEVVEMWFRKSEAVEVVVVCLKDAVAEEEVEDEE